MELQSELLLHLDTNGYLNDMRAKCCEFLKDITEISVRNFPPFKYLLKIDFLQLTDAFPKLGDFLLSEPIKWRHMSEDILYSCLQSMKENPFLELIHRSQVNVILRLYCVSELFVPPNQHDYHGLVTFRGILTVISKPENYVFHSVWSCPEQCDGSEIILHHIPKRVPKCAFCRSFLFENSRLRRCGDEVKATFALDNDLLPKSISITDDLIPKLQLGNKYMLVGTTVMKNICVFSLETIETLPAPLTSCVPKDVAKLFKKCGALPWKFIYCLSSSIGINVCPLTCFMHLKIWLLMSLVSIKSHMITGSNIIHVLASGHDSSYVGAIMTEAAKLADKSVLLGSVATNNVQATLVSCYGGICVMPLPLYTYNQKQLSQVLTAIESNEVQTENNTAKLKSAVWAQGMDFKKITLLNISSVFGSVCRGDYGEYNDELSDFLIQNAVDPPVVTKEEKEALRDLKIYIDYVAGLEVRLGVKSEELLRAYFVAVRKETSRAMNAGGMAALVATCLTSARVCRRDVASVDDAIFSVWLHASGNAAQKMAPDEYLQTPPDVERMQKVMVNFKKWLEEFIGLSI